MTDDILRMILNLQRLRFRKELLLKLDLFEMVQSLNVIWGLKLIQELCSIMNMWEYRSDISSLHKIMYHYVSKTVDRTNYSKTPFLQLEVVNTTGLRGGTLPVSFGPSQWSLLSHTHKVDLIPCRGWIKNGGISSTEGPASYAIYSTCVLFGSVSVCVHVHASNLFGCVWCCSVPAALQPVAHCLFARDNRRFIDLAAFTSLCCIRNNNTPREKKSSRPQLLVLLLQKRYTSA